MSAAQGRIALREEGDWWVAYWARPDTMDGALPLARVRMNLVAKDKAIKRAFIEFAQLIMTHGIEAVGGKIEGWHAPIPGPPHERGGP
jgi:hypothetical protein